MAKGTDKGIRRNFWPVRYVLVGTVASGRFVALGIEAWEDSVMTFLLVGPAIV